MNSYTKPLLHKASSAKQRGVVLFFALVAMLAMSLAAVALIRSVDTSTIIAGNLAFKQGATTASDAGIERALDWLANTNAANSGLNILMDPTHPFNNTGGITNAVGSFLNNGYYSNFNPALSMTDGTGIQWTNADSTLVGTDAYGNTIRYVIQRMCRTANALPRTAQNLAVVPPLTDCLYSGALINLGGMNIQLPQDVCSGPGCPPPGQTPQIRITVRTDGPKNTLSYVQAFVY